MRAVDSGKFYSDPKIVSFVNDVGQGNLAQVKRALENGISANVEGAKGFRPIHFAFFPRKPDVLKCLLEAGADAKAAIANGNTPLHFSVRLPDPEFTRVLLNAGADPGARGENGKPVIHEALSSGEPEVI